MQPLKITAVMASGQVAAIDDVINFDSLIGYVWMEENYPEHLHNDGLKTGKVIIPELPLEKRGSGNDWYYAASIAEYEVLKETLVYWHKRLDVPLSEQYVDFRGKSEKIKVNAGRYKNYRIPLVIKLIPELTWYVVGDKTEIERMVQKIYRIGKKRSQGFGEIKEWIVEEINEDYSYRRYIPAPTGNELRGIRPPYHWIGNQRLCRWGGE